MAHQKFEIATISSTQLQLEVSPFGASVIGLYIGNHNGSVIRAITPNLYPHHAQHFGAIAGPVANRLKQGRAICDGTILTLDKNEAFKHTLHSGKNGIGRQYWQLDSQSDHQIKFTLFQPDQMLGFPGNRHFSCTYCVGEDEDSSWLDVRLEMVSDAPTLCNMAFHPYFCLDDSGDILAHRLQVFASSYLPTDAEKLPTGDLASLAGTEFDFRTLTPLRTLVDSALLDHNFCLDHPQDGLAPAARLSSDISGITMQIDTNQPGLQLYCPHHLNPALKSRTLPEFGKFPAICIEPQKWPDAPNHSHFPSIEVAADQPYLNWSRFRFLT